MSDYFQVQLDGLFPQFGKIMELILSADHIKKYGLDSRLKLEGITNDDWTTYFNTIDNFESPEDDGDYNYYFIGWYSKLSAFGLHYSALVHRFAAANQPKAFLKIHDYIWDKYFNFKELYTSKLRYHTVDWELTDRKFPLVRLMLEVIWSSVTKKFSEDLIEAVKCSYNETIDIMHLGEPCVTIDVINLLESEVKFFEDSGSFISQMDELLTRFFTDLPNRSIGGDLIRFYYPILLDTWMSHRVSKNKTLMTKFIGSHREILFKDALRLFHNGNLASLYPALEVLRQSPELYAKFKSAAAKVTSNCIIKMVEAAPNKEARVWALIESFVPQVKLDLQGMPVKLDHIVEIRDAVYSRIPDKIVGLVAECDPKLIQNYRFSYDADIRFHYLLMNFVIKCQTMHLISEAFPVLKDTMKSAFEALKKSKQIQRELELKPDNFDDLALYLARYVDQLFRSEGYKGSDELKQELSTKINCIANEGFLHFRKRFFKLFYEQARDRLLLGLSSDRKSELQNMIPALVLARHKNRSSHICNIYRDIDRSSKIEEKFKHNVKKVGKREDELSQFRFKVLNSRHWQIDGSNDLDFDQIELPGEILEAQNRFESFHLTKHENQVLSWSHQLSFGYVTFNTNKGTYDICVSGPQLSILWSFSGESGESKSFVDLMRLTRLKRPHLEAALLSLLKGRSVNVMTCEPPLEKDGDDVTEPNRKFSVNYDFCVVKRGKLLDKAAVNLINRLWPQSLDQE